ncbi:FolC bifunctional protein [Mollisia scopiformis]|uniref:dihydrofolate synthase n=1 Tax=Mollisia scopiformis TaxID=149040 RepID=A0A194WWN8_MOLSC|nr:FolC bifunctional protein [Mollisia scopiformis]KUJ11997.1 FolC bifunctional protein [Mollisia scopiformis]
MIELGLGRISRLLRHTPQPWKAIHVAGTNGKGTICAYLSAMLHASGVRCGRFTSPHLIDRWDCITINEQTVKESVFKEAENLVLRRNRAENIEASEFELLTATAFEVFAREKIEMGVVEVGLGGRLDATNVMENKAVTVISKIGLDHQSFLGNTIEEITYQKSGIMRSGIPCVLDKSNPASVRKVVEDYAKEIGTEVVLSSTESSFLDELSKEDFEPHQWQNLACAYTAFHLAYTKLESPLHRLLPAVQNVTWPGRLQTLDIRSVTGRSQPVLLDGAHNVQSAEVLGTYVDKKLRTDGRKVTWVLAASQGKELEGILKSLLHQGDCVAAVKFGPVDGMPWVQAMETHDIISAAAASGVDPTHLHGTGDISTALRWATTVAGDGPLVIAGSLYLVSDVLRLLREAEKVKNELLGQSPILERSPTAGQMQGLISKKIAGLVSAQSSPVKLKVVRFEHIEDINSAPAQFSEDASESGTSTAVVDAREREHVEMSSPPAVSSRPSSPTKRRDISGLQLPIQKKLRFAGLEDEDEDSSDTSPTVMNAFQSFEDMSIKEENNDKTDSLPMPSLRIRRRETFCTPSSAILKMALPSTFKPYFDMEQIWEKCVLVNRRRVEVRVNKDGEDEIVQVPYSESTYVNMAKKVIRRFLAVKYNCYPYTEDLDSDIEFLSSLDLPDFIMISKPQKSDPIAPLASILRESRIQERLETFRCLAIHPYYRDQDFEAKTNMKQDLILLFDRRFTCDVAVVYGVVVPITHDLLRLGDDQAFCEEDGLDTGGSDDTELEEKNEAAWETLLKYGYEKDPMTYWLQWGRDHVPDEFSGKIATPKNVFLEDEEEQEQTDEQEEEVDDEGEEIEQSENSDDSVLSNIDDEPYVVTPSIVKEGTD